MKLILLRHGESEANAAEILSSKPSDPYLLTKKGKQQIKDAAQKLPKHIDGVYVSPLKRTLQTARILANNHVDAPLPTPIVEQKIKEIDYGIFSGHTNNSELDAAREAQVNGNYRIRFGVNGENKYDIEQRLYSFLIDLLEIYTNDQTVLIISHGSITGWLERIILEVTHSTTAHKSVQNGDVRIYELSTAYTLDLNKIRNDLKKYGN